MRVELLDERVAGPSLALRVLGPALLGEPPLLGGEQGHGLSPLAREHAPDLLGVAAVSASTASRTARRASATSRAVAAASARARREREPEQRRATATAPRGRGDENPDGHACRVERWGSDAERDEGGREDDGGGREQPQGGLRRPQEGLRGSEARPTRRAARACPRRR